MPQNPPSQADYNGLLKLMALIIHKAGGSISLDASDLYNTEPPRGFTKRWSNETKQLVIELVEHGTALYITNDGVVSDKEVEQWREQPEVRKLVEAVQPVYPQVAEKLKQAAEMAGSSHAVLDDARQSALERDRAKQRALREILEFQPPPAMEAPADRLVSQSSLGEHSIVSSPKQPPSQVTRLPRTYLKT